MHPKRKSQRFDIISGFTPGQDRPKYGTSDFAMCGGTIYTQRQGIRIIGAYPEM